MQSWVPSSSCSSAPYSTGQSQMKNQTGVLTAALEKNVQAGSGGLWGQRRSGRPEKNYFSLGFLLLHLNILPHAHITFKKWAIVFAPSKHCNNPHWSQNSALAAWCRSHGCLPEDQSLTSFPPDPLWGSLFSPCPLDRSQCPLIFHPVKTSFQETTWLIEFKWRIGVLLSCTYIKKHRQTERKHSNSHCENIGNKFS